MDYLAVSSNSGRVHSVLSVAFSFHSLVYFQEFKFQIIFVQQLVPILPKQCDFILEDILVKPLFFHFFQYIIWSAYLVPRAIS